MYTAPRNHFPSVRETLKEKNPPYAGPSATVNGIMPIPGNLFPKSPKRGPPLSISVQNDIPQIIIETQVVDILELGERSNKGPGSSIIIIIIIIIVVVVLFFMIASSFLLVVSFPDISTVVVVIVVVVVFAFDDDTVCAVGDGFSWVIVIIVCGGGGGDWTRRNSGGS